MDENHWMLIITKKSIQLENKSVQDLQVQISKQQPDWAMVFLNWNHLN